MTETYKTGTMPLPLKGRGHGGGKPRGFDKYKFGEMPVPANGLCPYFIVPYGGKTRRAVANCFGRLANAHGKRLGRKFAIRQMPDGLYVLRVA